MVQYLAQIPSTTKTNQQTVNASFRHQELGAKFVILPPILESSTRYDSPQINMASRGNTQHMIYRSVPPRPHSYTFTDVLDDLPKSSRSKTAPLHTTVTEEYLSKFSTKTSAKPKVIDFDGGNVNNSQVHHVNKNGFFPPLKLKLIQTGHKPCDLTEPGVQLSRLQLAPLSKKSLKGRRNKQKTSFSTKSDPGIKSISTKSDPGIKSKPTENVRPIKAPDSPRLKSTQSVNSGPKEDLSITETVDSNIVYPNIMSHSEEYDDLSNFPPPKKILPSRELPWVYRFKVKRGMNALSKIMASKPTLAGSCDANIVE